MSLRFEYPLPPDAVRRRIRAGAVEAKRPEAVMPGLLRPWLFQDDKLFGAAEGSSVWLLKKTVCVLHLPLWYFSGTLTAEPGGSAIEGRFRLSPTFLAQQICLHVIVVLLITGSAALEFRTAEVLIMVPILVFAFLLLDGLSFLLQLSSIRYVKRFLKQLN